MKVRKKRKDNAPKKVAQQIERIKSEESARQKLTEFLDHKVAIPKRLVPKKARKLSALESSMLEAKKRSMTGDWQGANGRTFVGLYGVCYQIVYGRKPVDLDSGADFALASRFATTALHAHFDDDPEELVEFIKWSWEREKNRLIWARERGYNRQRLIVRYQFSKAYIEDYKVHLSTKKRYARNNV